MYQCHRLTALLKQHRRLLLLPASASAGASAFSTTTKRPFARLSKAAPPAPDHPAGDAAAGPEQREKLPCELPRPSAIPFQPRVANAVRLVGAVGAPVQLQRTPDGRFSAVSVLVQNRRSDFPMFWIPVIFQDDLAQIAASHLQENDIVYVSGQLTGDVPPFKLVDGQANIQVLGNSLSFVDSKATEIDIMVDEEEEEGFKKVVEAEKKVEAKKFNPKYPPGKASGYKNKEDKFSKQWDHVIARPFDWTDNRAQKRNGFRSPKYPDFKNNVSQEGLWLNTAPIAVLEKLDSLVFSGGCSVGKKASHFDNDKDKGADCMKFKKSQDTNGVKKDKADLWQDLVDNPANWWDNRSDKESHKVSNKFPDFKHKETGEALWIDSGTTPKWARDALPTLKAKGASKGATRKQETLLS